MARVGAARTIVIMGLLVVVMAAVLMVRMRETHRTRNVAEDLNLMTKDR
ncbi:hypothetical protein [Sulfobacillus harzensis]|uniref:Uncharacterized protein n=1 Tax=Sulfobacillus harzensis TaxID=2729629 RepID=A0A7Y0L451_9FIRM|nr:hypothetical protein [Sulfobacillus harzensis]NMP21549.1 hypothetical protein [Sulfobacillus harzensis]